MFREIIGVYVEAFSLAFFVSVNFLPFCDQLVVHLFYLILPVDQFSLLKVQLVHELLLSLHPFVLGLGYLEFFLEVGDGGLIFLMNCSSKIVLEALSKDGHSFVNF
jgi:hypothetical protein